MKRSVKTVDIGQKGWGTSIESLCCEFAELTGLRPHFDPDYEAALGRLVEYLREKRIRPLKDGERRFVARVNGKLRLNASPLNAFYAAGARRGVTFHYHHKCNVQRAFDMCDQSLLEEVLNERRISDDVANVLRNNFCPVNTSFTLSRLRSECIAPSKLRREKGDRDIQAEIIKAHFSAFVWSCFPTRQLHAFFDPHYTESEYQESFWQQLQAGAPHLFKRDHTLSLLRIDQDTVRSTQSGHRVRDVLCNFIRGTYQKTNNHGFFAILLSPIQLGKKNILWELAADLTLYSEKHREVRLQNAYFRWQRVRSETMDYIGELDPAEAKFDLANEGFTYRDCFAVTDGDGEIVRLLLLFQKNQRDETLVPCPACRSTDVQGNSYPSLGVRSWECRNPLCPDRSKYNRGKRYSFRGLVMQQAIDDEQNEIPTESVRQWSRDVVCYASDDDILGMLVRHYSMSGDGVHLYNWPVQMRTMLGRKLIYHNCDLSDRDERVGAFWNGPFFARYVKTAAINQTPKVQNLGVSDFQVLHGDSAQVLGTFSEAFFDAAVTSPPYYNARKYAQWPNIYCYLYDMFNINREVFRTLKPGSLYFYNIFDYFDNEKVVAFSAMGQKRMILSAYTIDLFRRIGFESVGNVLWDKGEIEGKRGFNAGNFSPYYQSPFNCWEHVLVFRKPDGLQSNRGTLPSTNRVLRQKPVMKMVRGQNVHGHTAPFPDAIAALAMDSIPKGGWILDPFAGSLTTGRVASRLGIRSVCIERSRQYCLLGLRMYAEERAEQITDQERERQLALF